MTKEFLPSLEVNSTSGLGYANQLISVTGVAVVSGDPHTTAPAPRIIRVRVPGVAKAPVLRESPRLAEASWKRLAARERKKARAKGFKPSDVEKAVTTRRYRR